MKKKVFLLKDAFKLKRSIAESTYDPQAQLNLSDDGTPTIISNPEICTETKTFQAPTDDNPDPECERCY